MSTIAIRVTDKEKQLMEQFAKFEGKTLSAYIKDLFYEQLEDFEDMQAIKEYEKDLKNGNIETYPFDEVVKELGL